MPRCVVRQLYSGTAVALYFYIALCCLPASVQARQEVTRIAAASSMRFVLDELIHHYKKDTGDHTLEVVYGSSGNLYRQILQGAPYDMFLSADSVYTSELRKKNRVLQESVYAMGTLILFKHADDLSDLPAKVLPEKALLAELAEAVRTGQYAGNQLKLALANPAHAPFGRAAKEVLQSLDLWGTGRAYLVIADNVSQAAQFARTGAVSFAFVAQSLVQNLSGQYGVIPQHHYTPLNLTLALLSDSSTAHSFLAYTRSTQAKEIFKQYRLRLPE